LSVWQKTAERMLMLRAQEADAPKDKRFKHPEWSENAIFSCVKDSYLVAAKSILTAVREVQGMDDATARKVDFYTRQFVDALSPSNFVATNPEVLAATLDSGGQNLLRGLENLLVDLERGNGRLSITMTEGFPPRRKYRHDSRENHLPERAHAIDPIRAINSRSSKAATAHHVAVDQ
jgi:polyhydroxyalkanoate synthase